MNNYIFSQETVCTIYCRNSPPCKSTGWRCLIFFPSCSTLSSSNICWNTVRQEIQIYVITARSIDYIDYRRSLHDLKMNSLTSVSHFFSTPAHSLSLRCMYLKKTRAEHTLVNVGAESPFPHSGSPFGFKVD